MKTQIAIAFATLVTTCAFGQGVSFANTSTSLINMPAGTPAPVGSAYQLELFYGPQGTVPGLLVQATIPSGGIDPVMISALSAGRFSGGERDMLRAGAVFAFGATGTFQVRAWDSTYGSSWAAFMANPAAIANNALYGASTPWDMAIQASSLVTTPAIVFAGPPAGFTGLTLTAVPEPSVVALGVLGALVLLFRRRK